MPDHSQIPPDTRSQLPHLGTYRRVLPVSLERMYENTIDWAHLPHVHATSFASIECLDEGPWGFQARLRSPAGEPSVIELKLDRACRRWITRTLEGRSAGSEIWTHAFPIEPLRTDIVVDFFAPGIAAASRLRAGEAFVSLYGRLYDEDVAMMVERQRQLDHRVVDEKESANGGTEVRLGDRASLTLPVRARFQGRSFFVVSLDSARPDSLLAYSAQCPHRLGPLPSQPSVDGTVTCPWHGYRFAVASGECVSGAACRLAPAPRVEVDGAGEVRLVPGL